MGGEESEVSRKCVHDVCQSSSVPSQHTWPATHDLRPLTRDVVTYQRRDHHTHLTITASPRGAPMRDTEVIDDDHVSLVELDLSSACVVDLQVSEVKKGTLVMAVAVACECATEREVERRRPSHASRMVYDDGTYHAQLGELVRSKLGPVGPGAVVRPLVERDGAEVGVLVEPRSMAVEDGGEENLAVLGVMDEGGAEHRVPGRRRAEEKGRQGWREDG